MLRSLLTKPRSKLTTLAEVAGIGLLVFAVFRVSLTCGFAAAGVALIVIGVLEG